MPRTIIRNARLFTSTDDSENLVPGCLVFQDGVIEYVGPEEEDEGSKALSQALGSDGSSATEIIDAANRVVTPGFIDAHVHMLHFGLSLGKLDIMACTTLEQIRAKIHTFAASHPSAPRILCKGWIQASTGGHALAGMLDDLDPRPIYVEALDLHSVWCSSAALTELGVDAATKDPPGGTIHRDAQGRPSGLLDEGALPSLVWPFLSKTLTAEQKQAALHEAVSAYTQAGYTGVIDMAMDEDEWDALETYRARNGLPLHVAAHWLIPYSDSEREIQASLDRAIAMHGKFPPSASPSFCVVGIKLIGDGVVDSCTAALSQPYGARRDPVEPIWPAAMMARVIDRADAAGLQCAVHAIGDRTITQTIDAFARLNDRHRPLSSHRPRHRIEHLELASERDAKRLGDLGITASVQPVHSDPALFKAWPALLGTHRCRRAFPYREFLEAGAPLAFGTDAPTAAHLPLPNLYNATTRRSAIEPASLDRTTPQFAVSLAAALKAATAGAAYSRHAERWMGSLQKGKSADFVMLDTDWTPEGLLAARVRQTWFQGRKEF
ncbi:uncharacterized protein PV07_00141 [Cladophialophora immunda]|uniref:Amidohydrolase 3 domain-containing protein n=1 Tax=Cladophialophora immunda TaxID=569365 RepID=A0A0D1ZYS6_9EURO|nr:uncharacterized protein PV07_00141 [Cladophialophora immunda]KIW33281.1 hypothetical protein PV07_00141 [Cladophialophora immunda]